MFTKKPQEERANKLDGLISRGVVFGIISLLEYRRAYTRGLITGGSFNVGLYGVLS